MKTLFVILATLVFLAAFSFPAPAEGPGQSDMYTLDEIYYYLTEGEEPAVERPGLDPTSGAPGEDIPGFTKSLADILEDIKVLFEGSDAAPGQVLESVTFFSTDADDWGPRSGSIEVRASFSGTDGEKVINIPDGYYSGQIVTAVDSDLVSSNIRSGVNIFGVSGDSNVVNTSAGDATASQILSGKKAYVQGSLVTGDIPSKGAETFTPGTSNQTISAEQYLSGIQTISGDSDLVTGNIRSGVSIFGVAGDTKVVDTSTGNAIAADIKSGKRAWVDGAEITGTIAMRMLSADSENVLAGFYEETTLSGVEPNLKAENIAPDVVIFGITGTYEPPWYYEFGPRGKDEVVQIGQMYVAKWSNHSGSMRSPDARNWHAALQWADELNWLGKDDWRLPTGGEDGELSDIYNSKTELGDYDPQRHWSSTEFDATWAYWVNFQDGYVSSYRKIHDNCWARAVRDK